MKNNFEPSEDKYDLTLLAIEDLFENYRKDGYTTIHYPVSWQNLENQKAREFNGEYLSHLNKVINQAKKSNLDVVLDMHLDVPEWAYDLVGFDLQTIKPHLPFAQDTMNTIFFNSESYAPRFLIEGIYAEVFLLRSYCKALREVALRQKGAKNLIGFQLPIEPDIGLIGQKTISKSLFKQMQQAEGFHVNQRAWKDDTSCIWRAHGAWEINKKGSPKILQSSFFSTYDFLIPKIINKFHKYSSLAIESAGTGKIITVGPLPALESKSNN